MPLSTVSGILTADRAGQARPARASSRRALRARASRRAGPHRRQEARPDPGRRRAPRSPAPALRSRAHRSPTARAAAAGWEYVHVAIDDATRLAYAEVLADEKATTAVGVPAPRAGVLRRHGITVERVMTDNGSAYRSARTRSPAARSASATSAPGPTGPGPTAKPSASSAPCSPAGPTAPSTAHSAERTAALPGWLDHYNYRRPHGSLSHQPPASRLQQLTGNNLLGSYT